ncbi:hemolysin A [Candidatus Phycosocius bacilliformis]|uniref:Hemolysin A n=1 Tax=Candidatus Phycosocius bacilliformis TaxID=1445552 RepID=A0A2P2E8V6_9PROT|nr:TlyA family RNA methyltransferase [Candidatus Phycosocius bacilliformis]GBF57500.1 hemolysin A [Candidatus Phycosocius bacilliformis]
MSKMRADLLLVAKGLMPTRAKAREAIEAGLVQSAGRIIRKPADLLDPDGELSAGQAHPYVSRAGLKLAAALDRFGVDPEGRFCLDIGASTGGFTQVLILRGAAHVLAVDVGRDQLDVSLRGHPAITLRESTDARTLSASDLGDPLPDLIVIDVSFIGLEKILPSVLDLVAPRADLVALVKPQFQAGPNRVGKRGLVAPDVAAQVAEETRQALDGLSGFAVLDMMESPIVGGDGNREWLLHARRLG